MLFPGILTLLVGLIGVPFYRGGISYDPMFYINLNTYSNRVYAIERILRLGVSRTNREISYRIGHIIELIRRERNILTDPLSDSSSCVH
jgi:hypothetical protein